MDSASQQQWMTMISSAGVGLAAGAGTALGILVTVRLHAGGGFWGKRLGRSRFRRANLPVGGAIAVLLTVLVPRAAAPLLGAGAAMAVTAIAGRYVDPLPPER